MEIGRTLSRDLCARLRLSRGACLRLLTTTTSAQLCAMNKCGFDSVCVCLSCAEIESGIESSEALGVRVQVVASRGQGPGVSCCAC